MSCTQDIPTYCSELYLQYRSMVAMYKYDLHHSLGGFTEGLEEVDLKTGVRNLPDLSENCYLLRLSDKFPISQQNIGYSEEFTDQCIIPEGKIIMRYDHVLLTSEEVADIFRVSHKTLLKDLRSFKSDSEIVNELIHLSGV